MGDDLLIARETRLAQSQRLAGYADASLEDILNALCCFGCPRIAFMGNGWMCAIDMHVAATGTEFKVRSEFSCETPIEAARQCAERVVATLKQYS